MRLQEELATAGTLHADEVQRLRSELIASEGTAAAGTAEWEEMLGSVLLLKKTIEAAEKRLEAEQAEVHRLDNELIAAQRRHAAELEEEQAKAGRLGEELDAVRRLQVNEARSSRQALNSSEGETAERELDVIRLRGECTEKEREYRGP